MGHITAQIVPNICSNGRERGCVIIESPKTLTALRAGKLVQTKANELVRFAEVPPSFGTFIKFLIKIEFSLIL